MISQAKNIIKNHIGWKSKVMLMDSYVFAKNIHFWKPKDFEKKSNKLFVILPSLDWTYMTQRVHHIARAMRKDYDTIFLSSRKKTDKFSWILNDSWVWIASSIFLVQKIIKQNDYDQIIFYTTEINNTFLLKFIKWFEFNAAIRPEKFKLIYDVVDELEVQAYFTPKLYDLHEKFVRSADLVLASSEKLFSQIKKIRYDGVVLFENWVWPQDWKEKESIPEDLKPIIDLWKPIIWFYGAIFEWIDYELLEYCIKNSDYNYVFIWPKYDNRFSNLESLINCFYLWKKQYQQLNAYLQYFDVALWPFVIDEVTKSVSPLKVYEYMAWGKIVVATDLPFSRQMKDFLLIWKDKENFLEKISIALKIKDDKKLIEKIKSKANEYDWSKIVDIIKQV